MAEYFCYGCGKTFEVDETLIGDDHPVMCPTCDSEECKEQFRDAEDTGWDDDFIDDFLDEDELDAACDEDHEDEGHS
jgi:hypothetical protein